ncbi:helix-turn-helix domain-containing protein [Pseudohongiella spirulinae]|jgi:transcriptional regulator with XRE-family HTH domain|uniref:Putative transcriptional regulator n=1 Tax=Pseudohongiella spirulinae TaxID=1249552 RepID=A0A0S2KAZ6_9GAMM|nr:helix-turn-helix transcriptional regulator [Pseudohongiella spirulinae]ALO45499.1 putative transcriptional regulator [Pseudohongiella spirulinae]
MKKLDLSATGREDFLREQLLLNLTGTISEGELLKRLRKGLLGMSQSDFCKLAGISRRSLSDIENNRGPSTTATLNAAFGIFGLRLSLLPMNAELTKLVCADFQTLDGLPFHIKRFRQE